MWLAILLLGTPTALFGLWVYRHWEQDMLDQNLITYELTFPSNLDREKATQGLKSLSGIYKPIPKVGVRARETLCLEVVGDTTGIHHYLSFPHRLKAVIDGHLIATVPGIGFTEQQGMKYPKDWRVGAALRTVTPLTDEAGKPVELDHKDISVLLVNLRQLHQGETVMVQWLFTPSGQNVEFMAAGRIAVAAPSDIRARELLRNVLVAYRSLQVFSSKPLRFAHDLAKVTNRSAPVEHWPTSIHATDLCVVASWPIDGPQVPGMTYGRAMRLIPEQAVKSGPIVVGNSNFPGYNRSVGLAPEDLKVHQHIIGLTEMGKSTYMVNQMLQWVQLESGKFGLMFIDPHRDSAYQFANSVHSSRINDIVWLDFSRASKRPPGFNILEGDAERVASQVRSIFSKVANMEDQVIGPMLLRYGAMALAHSGMTILEMRLLMESNDEGKAFRQKVIDAMPSGRAKTFWEEYSRKERKQQDSDSASLKRRLENFEAWEALELSLGQAVSTFNFKDILEQGKIVIVVLDMSEELYEPSQIIGSVILSRFMAACRARAEIDEADRTPFALYVDEVHRFASASSTFSAMLDEMRKYGISFNMAHQRLKQLQSVSADFYDAVMANARNKSYFKVSASDAAALARELPQITQQHLLGLEKHEAVVRLVADKSDTPAATIHTLDAPRNLKHRPAVEAASARQYGTDAAVVRQMMAERRRSDGKTNAVETQYGVPND